MFTQLRKWSRDGKKVENHYLTVLQIQISKSTSGNKANDVLKLLEYNGDTVFKC
jgi:hypothetical protein